MLLYIFSTDWPTLSHRNAQFLYDSNLTRDYHDKIVLPLKKMYTLLEVF